MTSQFTAEVFQNQFLPQGARDVHAIMTVTATGEAATTPAPSGNKLFGIICDVSGSMQGPKVRAAKEAMITLVNMLPEDTSFFIVAGATRAEVLCHTTPATSAHKAQAIASLRTLEANGGTAISTWLAAALGQFKRMPDAIRQALLLTDGQNDPSDEGHLDTILQMCEGVFQCDCRGVGTDWEVAELQKIAGKLLGTTDIIPQAALIEADFRAILEHALQQKVSDVVLRLWTPREAQVVFCKQVSPVIVDLTSRAKAVTPQVRDYPTGAWGVQESRDFHFCITVKPGEIGDEMLAGRASLITMLNGTETKIAEARILAIWTDDEAKSTAINQRVAHYTGQAELAQAIQTGLEARARDQDDVATTLLGKAVKIAHESGNEATAKLLRAVVDVQDAATGTVRLKRTVAKEDAMALETRSTKTRRLPPSAPPPGGQA